MPDRYTAAAAATLLFVLGACVDPAPPTRAASILRVAALPSDQIRALDRDRTVVLLVGGILEEHGPWLPSQADAIQSERMAADFAHAIAGRPGWNVLVFPTIPLGVGGANIIGGLTGFPGSFTVSSSTLRSVYMDLADELGEQGFRRIFIVDIHGAPLHSHTLHDVGDYFEATYGGTMSHLAGLMPVFGAPFRLPTPEATKENGAMDVHAGAQETSVMLALRPDLVLRGYQKAPSLGGDSLPELMALASKPGWRGYLGAPRFATAALGTVTMREWSDSLTAVGLRILDGADAHKIPRYGDSGFDFQREFEAKREAKHAAWAARRKP